MPLILPRKKKRVLSVEDVFATALFTSTGAPTTVTTGIAADLTWIKKRSGFSDHHRLYGTGIGNGLGDGCLSTSLTNGLITGFPNITMGATGFVTDSNESVDDHVSWNFRKAPGFMDIVEWTGTGTTNDILHDIEAVPAVIIVKRLDAPSNWIVYHHSNTAAPETDYLRLNTTDTTADLFGVWGDTAPTSTSFRVSTASDTNALGGSFIAILFAHDTTDNGVIQCGSFTDSGSDVTVTLGWEPQWLLIKMTSSPSSWQIIDNTRGWVPSGGNDQVLYADLSNAEIPGNYNEPTSTGFIHKTGIYGTGDFIYIAIRKEGV